VNYAQKNEGWSTYVWGVTLYKAVRTDRLVYKEIWEMMQELKEEAGDEYDIQWEVDGRDIEMYGCTSADVLLKMVRMFKPENWDDS
jgi:hypothetical protein